MKKVRFRSVIDHLRLRHLRLLEAIVEHGTVRQAAKMINVSQPVASQMLSEIEHAFGGPLFIRNRSGVKTTPRLEPLIRRVRFILGELQAAHDELDHSSETVMRIGASLQYLTQLLPPALVRLHRENPHIQFQIREGSSDSLIEAVIEGRLDCAIARSSTPSARSSKGDSHIQLWPLGGGELCLVVGKSHPLAKRKRIRIEDLAGEQWALGVSEGQGRDIINRVFLDAGIKPPRPLIQCRPQFANLAFVATLPLIAVATRADAYAGERTGSLHILPIDISQKLAPISFVCSKSAANDPWILQLRDALIDAAKNLGSKKVQSTGRKKKNV
jgi:DNA-binding transcriptional LysR family regulator